MPQADLDPQVRTAAFDFLARAPQVHREVLPWKGLAEGYEAFRVAG